MIRIATFVSKSPQATKILSDYYRLGAHEAARKWHHLWPDKSLENIRKTITNTARGLGESRDGPPAEVREAVAAEIAEEKKEQLATIEQMIHEIYEICKSNSLSVHKIAKVSNDYKAFVASSQALLPATNVLSRMTQSQPPEKTKSGLAEMRETLKAQRGERVSGMETVPPDE